MDFAALMNNAMGKKKPASTTANAPEQPKPKFQKRSEIEAAREAAYVAEQKALEEARAARSAAKRKVEEDAATEKEEREEKRRKLAVESRKRRDDEDWEAQQARRKRLGLEEKERVIEGEEAEAVDGDEDVVEEELRAKLRELGHPVALFGESHNSRVKRYRKLTVKMTDGPIPTTLELVEGKDVKVDKKMPEDKTGRKWLYRQLASYFTMILSAYETAMEAEREDTTASRNAYATMVQTRENMKPVSLLATAIINNAENKLTSLAISQDGKGRYAERSTGAYSRDRRRPARAPLCRRQRRISTTVYRQGCLAHWCHNGGYSRAKCSGEAP